MHAHQMRRTLTCLILLAATGAWGQDPEPAAADVPQPDRHGVSGTLTDPEGKPVAGAVVWVRVGDQFPQHKYKHDDWLDPVSTRTDESGGFSLALSAVGPYRLYVLHPEHPPLGVAKEVLEDEPVELSFRRALEFSGEVRDEEGARLEGADVLACGSDAAPFGDLVCLRTRSGADGSFIFRRLSNGRFSFQAWAPGKTLSPVASRKFPREEQEESPLILEIEPGAEVSGSLADDAGETLPGVYVYYQTDRVRLRQARNARDVSPLAPTLTDEDGNFAFPGLPAGSPLKLFAWVEKRSFGESKTVTLEPGSVVGGLSIVYERPATATVRVIDSDERPVDSLDILWRSVKEGSPSGGSGFRLAGIRGLSEVESLGEGRFSIKGIKPDRYDVTLLPSGHQEIMLAGIRVSPGAEVELGTHVARPGVTLSGYVVDDRGAPIAGAKLDATYLRKDKAFSRSAKTDELGRFALGGLGGGPLLWLRAEADGHATTIERGVAADQGGYEIVLDRAGTVSGRILLERGDRPVGAVARLESTSGGIAAFQRRSQPLAKSDEEGYFEIADAAPGTYLLQLSAKDVRPLRVKDVVVAPGEATDVGTHHLEPGLEIRGAVVDDGAGFPVAGAAVVVAAAAGGILGKDNKLGTAITDAAGNFVVAGLSSGRLIVEVEHVDYAPAKHPTTLKEDEPAEELIVRLGQGGRLRGTVLDENGAPSPDRMLGILEGAGFAPQDDFVRTNEAGEYGVERMRPGAYRIFLYSDPSGNAMDVQQKNATIRVGEETVVDFGGRAKILFEGRLTRGGRPVAEVTVMLVPSNSTGAIQTRTANTDLSGRFEVGLNEAGPYSVIVQDLKQGIGVLVGQAKIVVPDEPTVSQEIVLQAGSISGSVTDASGQPIAGAAVSAVREGADLNEIGVGTGAKVTSDSTYRLEGVQQGTYTVSAIADGYEMRTRSVMVAGSSRVEGVDFQLEIAGLLKGRVVDANGNAIARALVFAVPAGAPEGTGGMPTEADAEGVFRLSAPSRGPCDITAVARGFAPGRLEGYVPVAGAEDSGALVTLPRGGTIAIRVVDARGHPVDAVQPIVKSDRPTPTTAIAMMLAPVPTTDATGSSAAVNLPEGSYRVTLAGHPEVPAQPVSVSEGGEAAVTLQLP